MNKTYCPCDECGYSYSKQNQEDYTCKICEFEMMLELKKKGRLLELPCTVGDTVYTACSWGIETGIVGSIEIMSGKIYVNNIHGEMIGESSNIFLDREEAEAALKKMYGVISCEENATLACAEHA